MENGIGLDVFLSAIGCSAEQLSSALAAAGRCKVYKKKKKSGGARTIVVAPPELCLVQERVRRALDVHHRYLLRRDRLLTVVHGFVRGKSPLTNALKHKHDGEFYQVDLRDAFGHVTEGKLRQAFAELHLSDRVCDTLLKLVSFHGSAPQGFCTSPVLLNLALREMDIRLKTLGVVFTRYADDICFSSKSPKDIDQAVETIHRIIESFGFEIEPRKCKRQSVRNGSVQVTGLSVNHWPNQRLSLYTHRGIMVRLPRKTIRAYRSMLEQACRGLRSQSEVEGTLGWVRTTYQGKLPNQLLRPYEKYQRAVALGKVPRTKADIAR